MERKRMEPLRQHLVFKTQAVVKSIFSIPLIPWIFQYVRAVTSVLQIHGIASWLQENLIVIWIILCRKRLGEILMVNINSMNFPCSWDGPFIGFHFLLNPQACIPLPGCFVTCLFIVQWAHNNKSCYSWSYTDKTLQASMPWTMEFICLEISGQSSYHWTALLAATWLTQYLQIFFSQALWNISNQHILYKQENLLGFASDTDISIQYFPNGVSLFMQTVDKRGESK